MIQDPSTVIISCGALLPFFDRNGNGHSDVLKQLPRQVLLRK